MSGLRRCVVAIVATAAIGCPVALQTVRADPTEEESSQASLEPDYAAGRKAIAAKQWAEAIRLLSSAALRDTRNADIQNYLGYAHRNSGNLDLAFKHYQRALGLNPRHRGAHEYIGEAYLMVDNFEKAEEHLVALQKICLIPCEELNDLRQKIIEYRKRKPSIGK